MMLYVCFRSTRKYAHPRVTSSIVGIHSTAKLFYTEFNESTYIDLSFVDARDKEVFLWDVE